MSTLLTRTEDDVLLIYFQDVRIIDESRIASLGQELTALTSDGNNDRLILNFKNVSFMSSAMIGKLVQFGKKCESTNIQLRMCDINDNIEVVFDLMKLSKVFSIDKDESASLKVFSKMK